MVGFGQQAQGEQLLPGDAGDAGEIQGFSIEHDGLAVAGVGGGESPGVRLLRGQGGQGHGPVRVRVRASVPSFFIWILLCSLGLHAS